jgi:hypothetical protein
VPALAFSTFHCKGVGSYRKGATSHEQSEISGADVKLLFGSVGSFAQNVSHTPRPWVVWLRAGAGAKVTLVRTSLPESDAISVTVVALIIVQTFFT